MKTLSAILLSITFILIFVCVFFVSPSNKMEITDEQILLITKNAYLKGYESALQKKDVDSSWSVISKSYNISNLTK